MNKGVFTIKGATVITDKAEILDVLVRDGRIAGIGGFAEGDVIDGAGMYLMAGFIDTHVHGVNGVSFDRPDGGFDKALVYEAAHGVTTVAPTTNTMPVESICKAFENIAREARLRTRGAKIAGIHAEGPFISHRRKGAMNEKYIISPSAEAVREMWERGGGLLRILSMAPEAEGMPEAAAEALSHGVRLSMAHTDATYEEAERGIDLGYTRSTHTFNGMRPFLHRDPGVLGAALTDPRVTCEAICDFVHLSPAAVRLIYLAKGAAGMCLVSDTGMASGMPDGEYKVGDQIRYISGGAIRLADGTISGSCHTLIKGVRDLFSLGVPLTDITRMASENPAEALGISGKTGSITVGKAADLVLLDGDLNVRTVWIDGIRQKGEGANE